VCFLIKIYRILKKEVRKVKGYRGAREFFFLGRGGGKGYVDKETGSKEQT